MYFLGLILNIPHAYQICTASVSHAIGSGSVSEEAKLSLSCICLMYMYMPYAYVYENAVKIRISFLIVAIDHLHAFTPLNELQTVILINQISHKKFGYNLLLLYCLYTLQSSHKII